MTEAGIIFRQLFHSETSTFTYLLGCPTSREAVLIDPVVDCVERDLKLVKELDLHLVYGINTHIHADHITGTGKIKKTLKEVKSVLGRQSGGKADVYLGQDDEISFGNLKLQARSTPGHTDGCMTYVVHDHKMAFTGDAVLIRGCGRTDFQQGSPSTLYDSVHSQIFSLPPHYQLYPAHDYKGFNVTTVDEETKFNSRLTKSKEEFIDIMNNLNLSMPKRINESVPANLNCGLQD